MSVLYGAPIQPVNLIRRTESELDGLRASGRDRLQGGSTDQVSLDLIVVTDKVAKSRHGAGAEDHAAQAYLDSREYARDSCSSGGGRHCNAVSHSYYCDHRAPDMLGP